MWRRGSREQGASEGCARGDRGVATDAALHHYNPAVTRSTRRIRGALLRLVRARWPAVALGGALLAPAALLWLEEYPWETWYTDGLALVLGATGAALVLAGVSGARPDWVE